MMIGVDYFIERHKDDSYDDLIKVRDRLIRDIRKFEKGKYDAYEMFVCPSPDVVYQCNLEYLSALCTLMQNNYCREIKIPEGWPPRPDLEVKNDGTDKENELG